MSVVKGNGMGKGRRRKEVVVGVLNGEKEWQSKSVVEMACATTMAKQVNNTMAPSMRLEDRYPDEAEKISRSMFCFCCFISHIVFSQLGQTYSP